VEVTIERLLQQAYLFDDPRAYRAGVEDAVRALEDLLRSEAEGAVAIVLDDDRDSVPAGVESRERRPA
jgi:hypothetical protein